MVFTVAVPEIGIRRPKAWSSPPEVQVRRQRPAFQIESITDTEAFRVATIDIPGHDLVTVRSDQPAPRAPRAG